MNFKYSSTDGLDVLKGVRNRAAVRAVLPAPFKVFDKTEFSENSTDVFGGSIIKIWYDSIDRISGVQLYHPEATLTFKGVQVLGASVAELEKSLRDLGVRYEYESDGSGVRIFTDSLELAAYAPELDSLGGGAIVEAIYIPIPISSVDSQ